LNLGKNNFILLLLVSALFLLQGCSKGRPKAPLLSAPPSAAADNDIYVADTQGRIRALRPDGTEQWTYSLSDDLARLEPDASHDIRIDYLAARSGGKLFGLATETSGRNAGKTLLFALDGNHLLWRTSAPSPERGSGPIAIGQTAVYEAGGDGVLYAFARLDGKNLWQVRVSQGALGSPSVGADGTVYVTGPQHNLHAIAPDGTERWMVDTEK
jgi:outer membrane protein assembly factor BamB